MGRGWKTIRSGRKEKTPEGDKKFDFMEEVLEPRQIVRTEISLAPS